MQVSFNLSVITVEKLKQVSNPDRFVDELIIKSLNNQKFAHKKQSRWALFAREIESDPALNLAGYSQQLKMDALEVREGFIVPADDCSK
jgi:hypothetical protein